MRRGTVRISWSFNFAQPNSQSKCPGLPRMISPAKKIRPSILGETELPVPAKSPPSLFRDLCYSQLSRMQRLR